MLLIIFHFIARNVLDRCSQINSPSPPVTGMMVAGLISLLNTTWSFEISLCCPKCRFILPCGTVGSHLGHWLSVSLSCPCAGVSVPAMLFGGCQCNSGCGLAICSVPRLQACASFPLSIFWSCSDSTRTLRFHLDISHISSFLAVHDCQFVVLQVSLRWHFSAGTGVKIAVEKVFYWHFHIHSFILFPRHTQYFSSVIPAASFPGKVQNC